MREKKTDEHEDISVNHSDKADELNYKAEIKPDCDWIIRSFTDCPIAREAGMHGFTTAKEYLAIQDSTAQKNISEDKISRLRN